VILSLVILGFGTLWIVGFSPMGGGQVDYEVMLKSSSGVRRGDRIRVSGVEVGRIKSADLRPGEEWPILFEVEIQEGIVLTEGSLARITSDGLLGAPYLEIVAGPLANEPLPTGSRIVGTDGGSLMDTLDGMGESTAKMPVLIEQLTDLVSNINHEVGPLLGSFRTLLSEENVDTISSSLASLNQTTEDVGPRLSALVSRLDSLATRLDEGLSEVPDLTHEITTLTKHLHEAVGPDGERLSRVLDSAADTLDSTAGALSSMAGHNAELESILTNLDDAAINLKSLSQTLKERPSLLMRFPRQPDRKPGDSEKE
jgi:phospholipid/cholesterol/gamma-HCH transport system substrate-binding protein